MFIIDSATLHQLEECIDPIRTLEDMVTDLKMIEMAMGGIKNQVTEKMTDMVDMGILIIVTEIVTVEIQRSGMTEMVIGVMISAEEAEVLKARNMAQEVGVMIGTENVLMKMMVTIHLGMSILIPFCYKILILNVPLVIKWIYCIYRTFEH